MARLRLRVAFHCTECGRTWTIDDDPDEWAYGHDCEPIDSTDSTDERTSTMTTPNPTVVVSFDSDGSVRSINGPFEDDDVARDWAEHVFPRTVWTLQEVFPPFAPPAAPTRERPIIRVKRTPDVRVTP